MIVSNKPAKLQRMLDPNVSIFVGDIIERFKE